MLFLDFKSAASADFAIRASMCSLLLYSVERLRKWERMLAINRDSGASRNLRL